MSDHERLKQMLKEAKQEFERLDDWMKSQEPAPGVSYQDWIASEELGKEREPLLKRKVG